jgi:dihydrofolate reductase
MAATIDGKIAKSSSHFPDWTSKEDKKEFLRLSKKSGAVIMGDKTFFTLPKPLPGRLNVVFTLLQKPPRIKGVKWVSGEPKKVLKELRKMGYKSTILGGGAYLNTLFLKKKLVDKIVLTIEPKIFGKGLSLFNEDFDLDLKLLSAKKINHNSIILRYKVLH